VQSDTSQVAGFDVDDWVEPAGQLTIGADLTRHFSIEAHRADPGSAGISTAVSNCLVQVVGKCSECVP